MRSSGQRPTFTYDAPYRTLSQFQQFIASEMVKAQLAPLTLALGLTDLGPTITQNNIQSSLGPTTPAIATALLSALNEIQEPFPLIQSDERPFYTNTKVAVIAANQAEGVIADDYDEARRTDADRDAAMRRLAIWLLCENYAYQTEMIYRVANTLILLGLAPFGRLAKDQEPVESVFTSAVGVEPYDYVMTLFALWAVAREHPVIDRRVLLQNSRRQNELLPAFDLIARELGRPFNLYRSFQGFEAAAGYGGKARACALFSRWPLIRLNDYQHVAAPHPFLKLQLGTKTVTKVLALARKTQSGQGSTRLSQWMGTRLEDFFAELCELWRPGDHLKEYNYLPGQKSPDRIVMEDHRNKRVACLFQLKLKMLLEATHYGADEKAIRADLESAFAETIYKTINFLARAEEAARDNKLPIDTADITRQILACDRFCLIGVVPDLPPVFTIKEMRETLMANVRSKLGAIELAWFEKHFVAKCIWHIMDLEEFEWFLTLPQHQRHFYRRLQAYLRAEDVDGPFVQGDTLPQSFRNFIVTSFGTKNPKTGAVRLGTRIQQLFDVFSALTTDVKHHFALTT